jgi:hypothetical protein
LTRGASGRRAIAGHRGGEGQVVEAELAATPNKLDEMIAGLTGPRTEVDDPDGLVRFTLSDDERLVSLFIDDAVRTSLNNLRLEKKRDDRFAAGNRHDWFAAGNEAVRLFHRCSRNSRPSEMGLSLFQRELAQIGVAVAEQLGTAS